MAKNKTLTVPQNGTQPASIPSPIDNMLSNTKVFTTKSSVKRPTSFNIDKELMLRFKMECIKQGRPMSSVVEDLLSKFVDGQAIKI